MARIRSIHPGLWTDEAFVTLSMPARLLCIGIWNEADDHGVFEWKPLTLKMRLMPADNTDVAELLEELATAQVVTGYEIEGKRYGIVRNFTKFQRPKKPTYYHPVPNQADTSSPPVPHHFPNGSEIAEQMEGGGDNKEDEGGSKKEARGACAPASPCQPSTESLDVETTTTVVDVEPEPKPKPPVESIDVPLALDRTEVGTALRAWNALAEELGLPTVQRLTATRRRKTKSRLHDSGGIDGWNFALAKIRGSPFLRGENDRGWRANIDFLLQESSFTKLMEGAYDRPKNGTGNGKLTRSQTAVAGILGDDFGQAGPPGYGMDPAPGGMDRPEPDCPATGAQGHTAGLGSGPGIIHQAPVGHPGGNQGDP